MRVREAIAWLGLLLASAAIACGNGETRPAGETDHATHEAAETRGPHGGRLLSAAAFTVELGIFERGVPPELRVWATADGRSIEPSDYTLAARLERLGGRFDVVTFAPRDDHLVSTTSIAEPHSFEVSIEASYEGERYAWEFESFEGRTRIDPEMAESLGVETEIAGPATLAQTITVYGRVRTNPERVREIRARFEGAIRAVRPHVGSAVRRGQQLLNIESDESLNLYEIVAPISGVVTQRDANPGEHTSGRLLMTITDTSSIWVDLSVFPVDRHGIVVGSPVSITPALGGRAVTGAVSLIETVADPHDQSVVARVVLEDAGPELLPGTFVTAHVQVSMLEVPLAVKRTGVQTFRDIPVVYARVADVYEVRMPELGRTAGEWVEVLSGLEPGTHYVTSNSHLIKADIEKSGAAHDH